MAKCERCKKRKAEMTYSESIMDFIHGNKNRICKDCYKKILEDRKKSIEKALEELK